jgi:hypothetical protein
MKLAKIFEEVVDFNKFRQAKAKPISVDFDLDKAQKSNQSVQDGLELLLDWIREYRESFRIPKFNGMDQLYAYLIDELKIPESLDQNELQQWYNHLTTPDKSNVTMIANNGSRIEKNLARIQQETDKFRSSIPKNIDLPEVVNKIYQNIDSDQAIVAALGSLQIS